MKTSKKTIEKKVVKNRRSAKAAKTGLLEDSVDKGARAVHEIHRSISDLPFNVLHRLGVMDQTISEVKRIHDTSVDAIYETIRDVNHKVSKLADDLLEDETARPKKEASTHTVAA